MGTSDGFFTTLRLAELRLRVGDAGRVGLFYEDQLGLQRLPDREGNVRLSANGLEPALIVLEPSPGAPPRQRGTAGLFHVAFLLPDRPSLGRLFAKLVEDGVRLGAADHGVSEALYLSDPEGNGIELYSDRPPAEWPAAQSDGQVAMFTEALDAPSLLAAGRTGSGPRLPEGTRIGHIHLSVSSLEQADTFYESVLGFPVRQRDYPGARFYGREGYHHHLAANVWQSRAPMTPGSLGLSRFALGLRETEAPLERAAAGNRVATREGPVGAVLMDFDGIEIALTSLERSS
jgi:catechol 2,3-dioxygenase